jgi:hypothetical protein
MTIDTNGNLGLGVTPSAWGFSGNFELATTNNIAWQGVSGNITANAYYALGGGGWKYKTTNAAAQYVIGGGAHVWNIAPSGTAGNVISFTQAMTLTNSGNLLLGTTSSYGLITAQQSGSSDIYRANIGTSGSAYTVVGSGTTMTVGFFVTSSGSSGQITCSGTSTTYATSSDYRLKNVIGAVTGAGERIDALEPIEYEWKSDGQRTRGFLAHKFQEVYAGSVTGSKDAVDAEGKPVYQAIQAGSSEVIADLVAEIKSLRKRLAAAGIA